MRVAGRRRAPHFSRRIQPGEFLRHDPPWTFGANCRHAARLRKSSTLVHVDTCLPACSHWVSHSRSLSVRGLTGQSFLIFFLSLPKNLHFQMFEPGGPPGRKRMGRRSGPGGNMGRLREVIITRFRGHASMPARDHYNRAGELEYLSRTSRLDRLDHTVTNPSRCFQGHVGSPVSSSLEVELFRIATWPSTPHG